MWVVHASVCHRDMEQVMNECVNKLITYKGKKIETLVDREDECRFDQFTWTASDNGNGRVYVYRKIWKGKGKKQEKVYLHRFLTNSPPGTTVDHINGDSLDNRSSNLRVGTRAQNNMNRAANRTHRGKRTTSPYKGVSWNNRRGKWVARIGHNYKGIFLGYFDSPEDGARAYDTKARELYGECAYQNFPVLGIAA